MLPANRVRADYDELAEIAETFQHQAENTRQTYQRLSRDKADLEGGEWIGQGAQKLYDEMNTAVLPTMTRLISSLEHASQITGTISRVMKQAENEAALVLGAVPPGGTTLPGGGPGDDNVSVDTGGEGQTQGGGSGSSGGSAPGDGTAGAPGGGGTPPVGGNAPVVHIAPGFPANFQAAWQQFQHLDQPLQPGEAAQFQGNPHLTQSALGRLTSLPNTRVVVRAALAPATKPDQSGGTNVKATLPDGRVFHNTGLGGNTEFVSALEALPVAQRAQVQFEIQIDILAPKYPAQRTPLMATDGYYLETLNHEVAIHGEKYADVIQKYQAGQPWEESTEYKDHQQLLYGGDPRFMLWTKRLYDARTNDPAARQLWKDYKTSLGQDAATLREVRPPSSGDLPLGWLEGLGGS